MNMDGMSVDIQSPPWDTLPEVANASSRSDHGTACWWFFLLHPALTTEPPGYIERHLETPAGRPRAAGSAAEIGGNPLQGENGLRRATCARK